MTQIIYWDKDSPGPIIDFPVQEGELLTGSRAFNNRLYVFTDRQIFELRQIPWYKRLWKRFQRWRSPAPLAQVPQDVSYKFKYEFFNSKTGERTDVTPSFERTE